MEEYIKKSAIIKELEKRIKMQPKFNQFWAGEISAFKDILKIINTLEVKEVNNGSLEEFKSLQHISKNLKSTLQDWGYAPNLYYFDGNWHVDWISCEEGDSIKDFTGDTVEEAINKAYNWFHSTFCKN